MNSRYKPVGWRRESYRHSLAARGVRTSYFAKKSPSPQMVMVESNDFIKFGYKQDFPKGEVPQVEQQESKTRKIKPASMMADFPKQKGRKKAVPAKRAYEEKLGERRLAALAEQDLREQSPAYKMAEDVKSGVFSNVYEVKTDKGSETLSLEQALSDPRFSATLKPLLQQKALSYASTGVEMPQILKDVAKEKVPKKFLGFTIQRKSDVGKAIEAVERQRARENEGALTRWTKETGKGFVVGAPEALATAGQSVLDKIDLGLTEARRATTDKKLFTGTVGQVDQLRTTPFFTTNVLVGDEEDGSLRVEKPQPLLDQLDDLMGIAPQRKTEVDRVKKEVDSVYGSKRSLAKVDTSAFEKGREAFKKGEREKLLKAISDLEGEEQKMVDRMNLVNQTHADVLSPSHRLAVHYDKGSGILGDFLGKNGGEELAEQTSKINEVRKDIKVAATQVSGRKQLLLYDLARMDAAIPQDSSKPSTAVKVVGQGSSGGGKVAEMADTLKKPLSGFEVFGS